jgi:hypothetical protein
VRHLLTAQARGPTAPPGRQSDFLGLQRRALLAKEVSQLVPAALVVDADDLGGRESRNVRGNRGNLYYQDNSFSCTWISMVASYTHACN